MALAACAAPRATPAPVAPAATGDARSAAVGPAAGAPLFKGELLPLDGGSLYVETAGEGPPLVFLHQFDANHEAWAPIATELAAHHRVVLIDLPGRGRSSGGDGKFFGYAQAAAQVVKAIDHLQLDKITVIGASTGGNVALRVAAALRGRVTTLVTMGGFAAISPEADRMLRAPGCEDNPVEYWAEHAKLHAGGEAQARALAKQFCNEVDNPELTTPFDVSGIAARTLVIQGDHDRFFPPRIGLELQQKIKGAALWVVPSAGHLPCFAAERRATCIATLAEFVDAPPR